ncbi:MAG: DEAD/DEAH box helicase, partial [Lachnospiraceae bacterium]|nr:DEAD/DEAH box helicase [Lachnospiraceae bacterium]
MQLSSSIEVVKGIGAKTIPKLNKLNIFTLGDLCFYLPRGFMDIHEPVSSLDNNVGRLVAIKGYIIPGSVKVIKKSRLITVATLKAENIDNKINVMYFNAPYIAKQLDSKVKIYLGVLSSRNGFVLSQPRSYTIEEYDAMLASPVPVYGLTKGISNNQLAKFIDNAVEIATLPKDYLSPSELVNLNLCDFATAIRTIHRPESIEAYNKARDRIVFHEFLNYFLEISIAAKGKAREFTKSMIEVADTARLIEMLPYRLTNAQLRCFEEIKADMTSGICMNRMLQGDVGSGKTIVAFLSLIMNAANNHQGALMAPTEVLACQHYEFALELVNKYKVNIKPVLLTGSLKASDKKNIREAIKTGKYNVIIGTHALINDVEYKDLS